MQWDAKGMPVFDRYERSLIRYAGKHSPSVAMIRIGARLLHCGLARLVAAGGSAQAAADDHERAYKAKMRAVGLRKAAQGMVPKRGLPKSTGA